MERFDLFVPAEWENRRADRFLADWEELDLSRSAVQRLFEQGLVHCGDKPAAKNLKLKAGLHLVVELPEAKPLEAQPQNIPLDILYEDDCLLVVNKPKGMVVHPAAGNPDGTLVNALLYHCAGRLSSIGGVVRPGIVHRIDKDTSGLLVVAKTDAAHEGLCAQMAVHSVERVYEAVVYGRFKQAQGFVEAPIGRHRTDRKKMAVVPDGKYAYTGYQVIAQYNGFTHIACRLKTGRTHQIRVHMASIGHPVAGDAVYGPRDCIKRLNGQCLHARVLGFEHPVTGRYLRFDSPLPAYFTDFLSTLRKEPEQ